MLQPGTILLEKYRVERVLGQGGMGYVVAVRHVQLGELFAIKTMLPSVVESVEAKERFLREARACARLKGEHVARVHDVGNLSDGTPYMLMEYLEGEDLGRIAEQRGALPLEDAAMYVLQACEAVAEAHAHNIVHRDLKPSNLFLIQRPNGTPCVKVLDFGISKELGPTDKSELKLTHTGAFLGSPMYMSPERMVDAKVTDFRVDIWSLGIILYELATGKAPFLGEAVTVVVSKVLLSHPQPPSKLCQGISAEFDAVVMRCLEKDPNLRFQSTRELMTALMPFAGVASNPRLPFGSEHSGSMPRAVIAPQMTLAETMPGPIVDLNGVVNIAPPIEIAQAMPDSMTGASDLIAQTIPGPNVVDVLLHNSGPTSQQLAQATVLATPLPIVTSGERHGHWVATDSSIANAPFATANAVTMSNPSRSATDRRKLLGIGATIGVVALLIVIGAFIAMSSSTDTNAPLSSVAVVSSVPDESVVLPQSSSHEFANAHPSASGNSHAGIVPSAATQATKSAPLDTQTVTSAPKHVPLPISTAQTKTKRKVPVRGYDD